MPALPIADPLAAQRTVASIAAIGAVGWALIVVLGEHSPRGGVPVSQPLAVGAVIPLGLRIAPAHQAERPYLTLLRHTYGLGALSRLGWALHRHRSAP